MQDEGYDLEVRAGHLLLKRIPYVNASGTVQHGTLVSVLDVAGDAAAKPSTHVASFVGEHPCHKDGAKISQMEHASGRQELAPGLFIDHSFSSKPPSGYADYYEKMTAYVRIISHPALSIDPAVTATPAPPIATDSDDGVFVYMDTASSRAGIAAVSRKLELPSVAIVGLGGTGSYVLDLVSKTPVKEIHIFDGDKFSNHNAFRAPGAASLEELSAEPLKVAYLHAKYSQMHRQIKPHGYYITEENVSELENMAFVFLCLDRGGTKEAIVQLLEAREVPFVDVGMGIEVDDDRRLGGILRVTSSTPRQRDHVKNKQRISFADGVDGVYARSIQVADLNALNAAMAVVKWKKLFGFYRDLEDEHFMTYTIDGNLVINQDQP